MSLNTTIEVIIKNNITSAHTPSNQSCSKLCRNWQTPLLLRRLHLIRLLLLLRLLRHIFLLPPHLFHLIHCFILHGIFLCQLEIGGNYFNKIRPFSFNFPTPPRIPLYLSLSIILIFSLVALLFHLPLSHSHCLCLALNIDYTGLQVPASLELHSGGSTSLLQSDPQFFSHTNLYDFIRL
jgi:hypothetical protein